MNHLVVGNVRPILLEVSQWGEKLAVAVVGTTNDGSHFGRVCSSRPAKGLSTDVAHACHSFGALVVVDFLAWCKRTGTPQGWTPPIGGMLVGDWVTMESLDAATMAATALAQSALYVAPTVDSESSVSATPRTSDEARFLESIKQQVTRKRPGLQRGFRKHFSLTGKDVGSEIDFVGSRYATCYAAVNPKAKVGVRLQTASAALWRLARAREAFGFAAPQAVELTAWIPPRGQPIYSERDYEVVDEMVAELTAQAKKEDLGVFTATDDSTATARLISIEVPSNGFVS